MRPRNFTHTPSCSWLTHARSMMISNPMKGAQAGDGESDTANADKGGLMTSEERSTGAVDRKVYFEYMKAMGPRVVLLSLVALFVVSNFTVQIQQW